ncbi:MAG TPA: DedA family protein [Chloroflexota bacterium]|nr:DedA family protein [Chloroflexota bacterium]
MSFFTTRELAHLVAVYGYWAILLGSAVDSFGLPVPGEIMVVTAAVYAGASHRLAVPLLIGAAALGMIGGDNLSFVLGREGGSRLAGRFGHLVHFDERRQRLARYLFRRHGKKMVFGGRFVPVVHVWTAFLAGTNSMSWHRFMPLNAVACVLWASVLVACGYAFGAAAVHVGGVVAAFSPLIAALFLVAGLLVVRLMERRWQREADAEEEKG